MTNRLKTRLTVNRGNRKNIMEPEYRCVIDLEEELNFTGTIEIVGRKELNGNIVLEINPFYESEGDRKKRLQYKKRKL